MPGPTYLPAELPSIQPASHRSRALELFLLTEMNEVATRKKKNSMAFHQSLRKSTFKFHSDGGLGRVTATLNPPWSDDGKVRGNFSDPQLGQKRYGRTCSVGCLIRSLTLLAPQFSHL